ncbi:MAG: hypothetical protein HUU56_15325 [Bdellovibrionaceae bacterium]|nr:hypothetical protein [Pseudobdellovibrionaceae bacterium]
MTHSISSSDPSELSKTEESLEAEAQFLHQLLFQTHAKKQITSNYIKVHQIHAVSMAEASENNLLTQKKLSSLLKMNVDLIALEAFLRLKNSKNILTKKIHILFYLTEVDPDYSLFYSNHRNEKFVLIKLVFQTFHSIFKITKGFWIYKKNLNKIKK